MYQKLLDPLIANWPIVAVAIWGTLVAVRTLRTIRDQTEATTKAAEAAQKDIELQRLAMGQWVETDELETSPRHTHPNMTEVDLPLSFRIGNPTKFPLTLKNVIVWVDRKHIVSIEYGKPLLCPDEGIGVELKVKLDGPKFTSYRMNSLAFEIGGRIAYIDALKEEKTQLFGYICRCGQSDRGTFELIAFRPPDEEKTSRERS